MIGITIVWFQARFIWKWWWMGDALAVFAVICLSMMFATCRNIKGVIDPWSVGPGGFIFLRCDGLWCFFFATPSSSIECGLIMGRWACLPHRLAECYSWSQHTHQRYQQWPDAFETVLAPVWALSSPKFRQRPYYRWCGDLDYDLHLHLSAYENWWQIKVN